MNEAREPATPSSVPTPRLAARLAGAVLVVAGLAIALPGHARPGFGPHGPGGSAGWIERHADELGIDEATLAAIDEIVEASRDEAEAIYEKHRAARDAMHDLLDQDQPDVDAVMRQAELIGEIEVRKHQHRLKTLLAIRAKLTTEQRSLLREKMDEMHERQEKFHQGGKHGRHWSGSCAEDAPPPASEEP